TCLRRHHVNDRAAIEGYRRAAKNDEGGTVGRAEFRAAADVQIAVFDVEDTRRKIYRAVAGDVDRLLPSSAAKHLTARKGRGRYGCASIHFIVGVVADCRRRECRQVAGEGVNGWRSPVDVGAVAAISD